MKPYKSENISELMANIESTVKGGTILDENGVAKNIIDSKDVAKKKKEFRTETAYVSKNEKQIALVKLSEAQAKNQHFSISASELKFAALTISSHIGDYVAVISGSKKYGEMTSSYLAAILIQSILSSIKENQDKPSSDTNTSRNKP